MYTQSVIHTIPAEKCNKMPADKSAIRQFFRKAQGPEYGRGSHNPACIHPVFRNQEYLQKHMDLGMLLPSGLGPDAEL